MPRLRQTCISDAFPFLGGRRHDKINKAVPRHLQDQEFLRNIFHQDNYYSYNLSMSLKAEKACLQMNVVTLKTQTSTSQENGEG